MELDSDNSSGCELSYADELEQRRQRRKPLSAKEKQTVVNIHKYVHETESKKPGDALTKKQIHEKTAEISGIGPPSVYRILEEYARRNRVKASDDKNYSAKISLSEKMAIRQKIYTFFLDGIAPTGQMVLDAINEDETLPNLKRKTFDEILKSIKFHYVIKNGRTAMIDKDDVVLKRRRYLDAIQKFRKENRQIFYLDEMYPHEGITPKAKTDAEVQPNSSAEYSGRLFLAHIGNENGFIKCAEEIFEIKTNNPKEPMTAEHFESWFEKVLPKLGEKAVVVMDRASRHLRTLENIPNVFWKKEAVQEWLRGKGIQFGKDEFKIELMQKVNDIKEQYTTHAVEEIAKKYNVEVLRYPNLHNDLNPIVNVFAEIKAYFASKSFVSFEEGKKLLQEAIENVSQDKWEQSVKLATDREDFYYKLDDLIDNASDAFLEDAEKYGTESSDERSTCSQEDVSYSDEGDSCSDEDCLCSGEEVIIPQL